ncbi:MAG: class I SAM-dependent methyltransferase [Pseudomonadota bacterium]|nr:class I SAM-dependent methyltransferase [Pseudomonadota bacterium]
MTAGRGPRARARIAQRWYGSPFLKVERWVPQVGRIVDLGCGFGLFSAVLALGQPERVVHGIDVDARKIERAKALFGVLPNVEFQCLDLADARLEPCDAVVFYDVLHHLRDALVERLLAAAYDALSPGGQIIVKENDTEPFLKRQISEVVERVAVGLSITQSDPVHFRSRGEWVAALEAVGFRIRHAEHLRAKEGFFVPHSLFVGER